MKKATIISAFLGTLIEVYDFTVFPFLIPILSEVFFSYQTKNSAINFTILAYVVSYIVKPFGGIGFGFLIDHFGRKKVLLFTTLLMTLATSAIGILPARLMGIYFGAGLIACRIIQGLSISGEFSSAIIMAVEQGNKYPAFSGCLAFVGGSIGLLLANLSIFILLYVIPHDQIIQYAWRIPFLVGAFGCLILLCIRNRIEDSAPGLVLEASSFRNLLSHKKQLLETFIISSLSASAFYITFIFMPTYLSTLLHLHSHKQSISITLIALLVYVIFLPLGGVLADKIGVKRQIKIASICYLLFSYIVFTSIPQLTSTGCIMVLVLFAVIQAVLNSALPAFMVAQFQQNQRGRALALSYNTSLSLFAVLMPLLLLSSGKQLNPGIPITLCAGLSLLVINLKGNKYGYLRSQLGY